MKTFTADYIVLANVYIGNDVSWRVSGWEKYGGDGYFFCLGE